MVEICNGKLKLSVKIENIARVFLIDVMKIAQSEVDKKPFLSTDLFLVEPQSSEIAEKLRYKISINVMLKFSHRTAWEGDDCDVIVGNISCPNLYPSNRRITSINIPGLGVEPHYKSFSAKALSLM